MAPKIKRPVRETKKTLLMVGEGCAEKAFLQHLRGLYSNGKIKHSIHSANGKGPHNVIKSTIAKHTHDGYDYSVSLLDTDIVWPEKLVQEAKRKGIHLIGSIPCLEGFLLDIINEKKPETSPECKRVAHPKLAGRETERESYEPLFTKQCLDTARERIDSLNKLINLIINGTT